MGRSQEEFWKSSFAQVTKMIDMYVDDIMLQNSKINDEEYESKYFKQKEEVKVIKSMKEMEGW